MQCTSIIGIAYMVKMLNELWCADPGPGMPRGGGVLSDLYQLPYAAEAVLGFVKFASVFKSLVIVSWLIFVSCCLEPTQCSEL